MRKRNQNVSRIKANVVWRRPKWSMSLIFIFVEHLNPAKQTLHSPISRNEENEWRKQVPSFIKPRSRTNAQVLALSHWFIIKAMMWYTDTYPWCVPFSFLIVHIIFMMVLHVHWFRSYRSNSRIFSKTWAIFSVYHILFVSLMVKLPPQLWLWKFGGC